MIRIVHTADVHLGGSHEGSEHSAFGSRTKRHQEMKYDAFRRCVDLSIQRQADALLVAGDLFDNQRPPQRAIDFVRSQFQRLSEARPQTHVFLLPGTHDCIAAGGIWTNNTLNGDMENVHALTAPEGQTMAIDDLGLAVHGRPQACSDDHHEPLRGIAPIAGKINLALAHGSVFIPDITERDGSLIRPEELEACGMDYVALGHWHSPYGALAGPVTAWYSGSPEILAMGQSGAGYALVVELDKSGPARVEQVKTGALSIRHEVVDVAELTSEYELSERLTALSDDNLVLDVTLGGVAPPGLALDIERIIEQLEGAFFRLRVRDASEVPVDIDGMSQEQIAGRFVELLRERLTQAQAQGDERAVRMVQRALQLGVALLAGKDVLA